MIKLSQLINEAGIDLPKFTAINKDSGKISVFTTKDARDSAIKSGTHEKSKDDKDGGAEEPGKKDTPKVNIFNKDKKSEPKKDKAAKGGDSSSGLDNAYNAKDFESTVSSLKGKIDDKEYEEISDELEALDNMQMDMQDLEDDGEDTYNEKMEIDSAVEDLQGRIKQALSKDKKSEPKKTQGKLSKFIYGDDDEKPDVVAKPEGKPDLSKYSTADEDWYTKDAASISTIYNDKLTIDDLQNVFKAKGYGDVTDTTLDDIVDRYNDDEDMRDRFKDNGISKGKLTKRIKDLKAQLKSGGTKSEPTKDSTQQRAGNPEVNKAVRKKAQSLGITPKKLGKEEYESRMSKAAVEALTDANFHSEARKLIAVLEDKPEWANDPRKDPKMPDIMSPEYEEWQKTSVYSSELYDSAEGTDDIAHEASNQAGWDGVSALDAIAFDLKMNGSKNLAAKIQGIIDDTNESTTSIADMIPESIVINEGTRSQVGIIDRSGKIASAYVHYDGYPSNMKPGLKKHMKNEKDVLKLIKMGGARGIFDDKEIEYYKSGKPTKGDMKDFGGYVDAADRNGMAEYVYLYNIKDKKWYFADVYGDKKLKKLF